MHTCISCYIYSIFFAYFVERTACFDFKTEDSISSPIPYSTKKKKLQALTVFKTEVKKNFYTFINMMINLFQK